MDHCLWDDRWLLMNCLWGLNLQQQQFEEDTCLGWAMVRSQTQTPHSQLLKNYHHTCSNTLSQVQDLQESQGSFNFKLKRSMTFLLIRILPQDDRKRNDAPQKSFWCFRIFNIISLRTMFMKDQNLSTPNLVIQCATVQASRSSEACMTILNLNLIVLFC